MAIKTISRQELAKIISRLHENALSGVVIVQTDARRAIVLRFAEGRLVRVNARGNSVDDAIGILRQSDEYRCSFNAVSVDDGPELLAIPELIERLGTAGDSAAGRDIEEELLQSSESGSSPDAQDFNRDVLSAMLVQLAAEAVGPMASMLVEQALDDASTVDQAINLVAEHIPDNDAASQFRERAIEGSREAMH